MAVNTAWKNDFRLVPAPEEVRWGYPKGAKSYNEGKPIRIEEFDEEKKWWGKPDKHGAYSKRKETERAWRVSIEQIKAGNFNLDLKNPNSSEDVPGDVDHLLPEYEKLLAQIAETRGQLKEQLRAGLERGTEEKGVSRRDAETLRR